jgi:hypothetical protein
MARTFRECPACGKRALSIATRCPACGQELLTEPVQREAATPRTRRRSPVVALAALGVVLPVAILAYALAMRRAGIHERETPVTAAVPVESPTPLDTARAASSLAVSDSAPTAAAVTRYARTWTNVRAQRSPKGDVVAVLLPGDTVLADSLKQGWWRVALEGQVLGYVYAPTLAGE